MLVVLCVLSLWIARIHRHIQTEANNEPPFVPYWIPYIGNAIAYGKNYYQLFASVKATSPHMKLASLTLMGHHIYIVTRPQDVLAVYKSNALQFEPIIVWGMGVMFGLSPEGQKLLIDESNGRSLIFQSNPFFRQALSKGDSLDDFASRFQDFLTGEFKLLAQTIKASPNNTLEIDLLEWVWTCMGTASTIALMGNEIFTHEPNLLKCSWKFEHDLSTFQMHYPPFLAYSKYQNREHLIQAFLKVYQAGQLDSTNTVWWLHQAQKMSRECGLTNRDIAIMTFGTWTAATSNTSLAAFWLLMHIISNPNLMFDIQNESSDFIHQPLPKSQTVEQSSLFSSVFNEMLRHYSTAISYRGVMDNTSIAGYTFRKGAMVICPGRLQHLDPDIWGPDVDDFVPDRFVRSSTEGAIQGNPNWLKPFGGGVSLCPGRFFATSSIMNFVASLLNQFEIHIQPGQKIPKLDISASNIGVGIPTNSIKAVIRQRQNGDT
ncbi:cytochrome P450 [Lentinula raphanica]|nr:cytochrome P450 [Lentinula raphanica]